MGAVRVDDDEDVGYLAHHLRLDGSRKMAADRLRSRIVLAMALVGIGMAGFSSPNTSAAMGVVSMDMLGIAAAVLATMRSLGQSVSMAALGGIAAHELGRDGGRVILGGDASGADATAYLSGYRTAMLVGSAIAVIGMLVSLTRGAKTAAPSA